MRVELTVLVCALAASACVSSDVVHCEGDVTCPAGDTCIALGSEIACATPTQIAACEGLADGAACSLEGVTASTCVSTACFATICGDGRTDPPEACDDGNTQPGDGCSSDCRSTEICGNGVVDALVLVNGQPEVNELCDDGNLLSGDGCSSRCNVESPQWTSLDATTLPLSQQATAYDSARGRIVMFGGTTPGSGVTGDPDVGVTYEWDGKRWFTMSTLTSPSARDHAQMAYDPVRHRTLLFGGALSGNYGAALGDTWEWDGTTWWARKPAHRPSPRAAGTLVYDASHKRMVLFGGRGPILGVDSTFDETWTWDGNDWTQLPAATHPGKRGHHVGGYDPKRGVVVIAGGDVYTAGENDTYPEDTWELDDDTWTPRGASPAPLAINAKMAWDPVGQHLITYGGVTKDGDSTATMWWYDGAGWHSLADTTPGPRFDPGLETDPRNGAVIMYGGVGNSTLDETWSWNGTAWAFVPPPPAPPMRAFAAVANDPVGGVAWVFGGNDESDATTNSLLSFDGSTWDQMPATGTAPSARLGASAAYDRARGQLVVFGGGIGLAAQAAAAETFLYDGSWSKRTTDPAPMPREFASMAYDPRNQRVVLYGGFDTSGGPLADTWAWNGTQWQQLDTSGPGSALGASMIYDDTRGTLVLFTQGDVWELDGMTWTQVDTNAPLPGRFVGAVAWDPVMQSMIVHGGFPPGSDTPLDDTWAWDGQWSYVSTTDAPDARAEHVMFSNPAGAGVILYGGRAGLLGQYATTFADTWKLAWESTTARESCVTTVDLDKDGLAGCADPDCWYVCTPACPPGAVDCDAAAPSCGDGTCDGTREDCRICPDDCTCGAPVCGDSFCDANESTSSCPGDCPP